MLGIPVSGGPAKLARFGPGFLRPIDPALPLRALVQEFLPHMLEQGDGAILTAQGAAPCRACRT